MRTVILVCTCDFLLQFHPPGGPVEGGTELNVSGINLGITAADLQVTVAGKVCNVLNDNYVPSQRCVMSISWNFCTFCTFVTNHFSGLDRGFRCVSL